METRVSDAALPHDVRWRIALWKGIGAIGVVLAWGWFAFVRNEEVPVLQFLDIAVHEIGHRVFAPFGEVTMLMMGSGTEVLFPLLLGLLVFGVWKRDLVAWAICWAWAAGACADASRYMADATQGKLALLGGDGPEAMGDWERVFGPEHWDKLYLADRWAHNVRVWGLLIWLAALGLAIAATALAWKRTHDAERAAEAARRQRPAFSSDPNRSWAG